MKILKTNYCSNISHEIHEEEEKLQWMTIQAKIKTVTFRRSLSFANNNSLNNSMIFKKNCFFQPTLVFSVCRRSRFALHQGFKEKKERKKTFSSQNNSSCNKHLPVLSAALMLFFFSSFLCNRRINKSAVDIYSRHRRL